MPDRGISYSVPSAREKVSVLAGNVEKLKVFAVRFNRGSFEFLFWFAPLNRGQRLA